MVIKDTEVILGADHNGFHLKNELAAFLRGRGYEVIDLGPHVLDPADDFPAAAANVSAAVLASKARYVRGILFCSSGQGVCIAANRFKGIRASLGYDQESVRSARNDDDSNVLCLPARELTIRKAESLVMTWLNTAFAGAARFKRRIKEIDELG